MQVAKWGNSLAIRIPADTARALGLEAGNEVDFILQGDAAVLKRRMTKDEAMAQLRSFRTRLPEDYKFDREEASSRSPDDR